MRKFVHPNCIVNCGIEYQINFYKDGHKFDIEIRNLEVDDDDNIMWQGTVNCPDCPDNVYSNWMIEDYGTDEWPDCDKESSIGSYADTITELGVSADIEKLEGEGLPKFAVSFVREFLTDKTRSYVGCIVNDYWYTKQKESN